MNKLDNNEYRQWLTELKLKIQQRQIKAVIKVNIELLQFYWELGQDIIQKQAVSKWGDGFLSQLSKDLMLEFPNMKGFSKRNLELIRQWYLFYTQNGQITKQVVSQLNALISQQPVGQIEKEMPYPEILSIPWGQNIVIITKSNTLEEALFYVRKTLEHNWSRTVLTHQIESKLYQREGKALTNFKQILPIPHSDLAKQTLKDPYIFDFLTMTENYNERDLENNLIEHISQFLLELGAGFAFIGKQINLSVSRKDFFLDLLFYHTRLHCYIVIELKTIEFEPEHAGKMNFYIKAVDEQYRQPEDNPTIGLLICKSKDKLIAEYALSDINKPIGISEYVLTQSIPDDLKSSLPSIEEIEVELGKNIKEA